MDTLRSHILYMTFIVVGALGLGLIQGSIFLLVAYSLAVIIGALVIAWAAESSEIVISQGLALAIVAWLQVMPEFMIEATIAWAQDVPNMLANFTGANRILTGIGWPLVFFTTMFFYRRKTGQTLTEIKLGKEHSIEVVFFFAATVYSIVIFLNGALTVLDGIFMASLYVTYLFFVSRLPHLTRKKSANLVMGIPKTIISMKRFTKPIIVILFLVGGLMIYLAAEPFYKNAVILATSLGISQFLFIQWVAPFLSEFPEKTSAFYWASKVKQAPMALMNLISSKLTQWTLLMAMIPIVFSISVGSISSIPLTSSIEGSNFTVGTEFLLTIATSFYACMILMNMRLSWLESLSLLVLWIVQFVWIDTRPLLIWVYFGLGALEIVIMRGKMLGCLSAAAYIFKAHILRQNRP